jgi:hypothetical protein
MPIYWKSTLQTEVALSSTEAEYIALAHVMREILPVRRLLLELGAHSFLTTNPFITRINLLNGSNDATRIHEDNASCIVMATSKTYSSRTRHIATKYHRLRDAVTSKDVFIEKIHTSDNPADIFTKPLSRETFQKNRKTIMGW